jgi:hypothetical protein
MEEGWTGGRKEGREGEDAPQHEVPARPALAFLASPPQQQLHHIVLSSPLHNSSSLLTDVPPPHVTGSANAAEAVLSCSMDVARRPRWCVLLSPFPQFKRQDADRLDCTVAHGFCTKCVVIITTRKQDSANRHTPVLDFVFRLRLFASLGLNYRYTCGERVYELSTRSAAVSPISRKGSSFLLLRCPFVQINSCP